MLRIIPRPLAVAVSATLLLCACSDDASSPADTADAATLSDTAQPDISEDADAVSSACANNLSGDAEDPVITDINGWAVAIDAQTGAWSVRAAGADTPALSGPGSCEQSTDGWHAPVRLAAGEPKVTNLFGGFKIELDSDDSQLDWTSLAGIAPQVEPRDGGVVIRWPLPEAASTASAAELRFIPEGPANLAVELAVNGPDTDVITTGEIAMNCQPGEAFFGLGSQATGMDLRGRTYPLWSQEQGNGKPEGGGVFPLNNVPEAAYAPMGIWHSSRGYSAIIAHDQYSEIDLCSEQPGRVHLRSHGELPKFVLVAGDSPRARLTALTEYTGRLNPAPPAWVFGTWLDAVGGAWRIDQVARNLRNNRIPASAIWTEDWIGGRATPTGFRLSYAWEWSPEAYPDLPATIDALHADGFAFLGYFNPFIPETVAHFEQGKAQGYLIKNPQGEVYTFQDPAFRTASLVDLTNPDALDWLREYQLTAAAELGIDGWMADFAEWLPVDAKLASGQSGWEFHNRYPIAWQEANRRALSEAHAGAPGEEPSGEAANNWTFFARSGWASTRGGSAGSAPLMWGGDQNTDWSYDDGFATIVPIGAHLGMSGVAIFGSDIAGYNSLLTTNTDKELFFRWSATAAFHPLMRTHHGGDKCANWQFDRDAETLAHFGRYAAIHSLLFPIFQRLVDDAMHHGWPMTRHPFLVEPRSPALWSNERYAFFLGDDILVGPVLEQGVTRWSVALPGEGWWPLFGDTPFNPPADASAEFDAPITEVPVFVRPGTILALLAEPVDSFYGSDAPDITDLSDVANRYRLAIYPAPDGAVALASHAGLEAAGTGWLHPHQLDWAHATLNGEALADCASAGPTESCADAAAKTARLVGVTHATFELGAARLTLRAPTPTEFTLGVGAAAWGELAEPTVYTGPNADAASWCDPVEPPDGETGPTGPTEPEP